MRNYRNTNRIFIKKSYFQMGSGEPLEFDPGGNADQDSLEHNNRNENKNESRQARRNRSSWGF